MHSMYKALKSFFHLELSFEPFNIDDIIGLKQFVKNCVLNCKMYDSL